MSETKYDVVIIGAGAVGCALARELSRYHLKILVLEASDDVGSGATRANSGIVHGGYAAKNGSLKARFCSAGNSMFPALARELDFPYRQTGSVVLAFDDEDLDILERLLENGRANGVPGLEITGREETLQRIPRLNSREIRGGLFCHSAGFVSPYEYAIAMAENAGANGVEILLNRKVTALEGSSGSGSNFISLEAVGREYRSRFVVNAAGAGAAEVAGLAAPEGTPPFSINPRKGQYIVFRRGSAEGLDTVVFQPPTARGKGILVTPTTWGNLLIGPDAQEVQSPGDVNTDPESLAQIIRTAWRSINDFDLKQAIRVFSGSRPASNRGDFIIEWSETLSGLLHLAGIESPGLTSSPAIALEAVRMLEAAGLAMKENPYFRMKRKAGVHPGPLGPVSAAAKATQLPKGNPDRVVCRCEQVTEGVIRDALSRNLPIRSTDGVKRRTRAGMGACQGSFCGPGVKTLVAEAAGIAEKEVSGPSRERVKILENLAAMRELLK
ncbi:MAG: NAD(P)/FAD-dependent oxidoreductase [Spirochaetaceae bacterium]|nr:NAD(P)/FAD-dependent oxidoreductase [Spirochaetaceae bacterium]